MIAFYWPFFIYYDAFPLDTLLVIIVSILHIEKHFDIRAGRLLCLAWKPVSELLSYFCHQGEYAVTRFVFEPQNNKVFDASLI